MKQHPGKILSMTEFVLWLHSRKSKTTWDDIWKHYDIDRDNYNLISKHLIYYYAKLLQTPLSPEMFVATKDGKVLKEPKDLYRETCYNEMMYQLYLKEYKQACKKILFEGAKYEYYSDVRIHSIMIDEFTIFGKVDTAQKKGEWGSRVVETIEDLIRQKAPVPTENFWNKIFKL